MIHFDQTHGGQGHVDSIFIFFPNGLSCHTTVIRWSEVTFSGRKKFGPRTVLHCVLVVKRLNKHQLFGAFVVGQIQLWVVEGSVEPRFSRLNHHFCLLRNVKPPLFAGETW